MSETEDKMASGTMIIANISGPDINDMTIMSDRQNRIKAAEQEPYQDSELISDPVVSQMVSKKRRPKTGNHSRTLSNHFDANILGCLFEKTNVNAKK